MRQRPAKAYRAQLSSEKSKLMSEDQKPVGVSIPKTLQTLAPTNLEVYREERYNGGGFSASLAQFAPEDVSLIIRLYTVVKKTYDLWLYMRDAPNYELLKAHIISQIGTEHFLSSAQAVGAATYALDNHRPELRKIIHDVRGGALTVLAGYVHFLKTEPENIVEDVETAVLLARDHAKLMRNAIDDLDPVVRQADESLKIHLIDDFVQKWHGSVYNIAGKSVEIQVACTFQGSVTNRCLETSAIDRVLYNYINNAARFSADNSVSLTIFQTSDTVVRWVVQNAITAEQRTWLNDVTAGDLKRLYWGGLTRGGHGIGLSSCADFVAASFGGSPEVALEQGYLGAKIIEDHYYAWFHWPEYRQGTHQNEVRCDCGP
jgi:K+-sensing histidine kinase KdpD